MDKQEQGRTQRGWENHMEKSRAKGRTSLRSAREQAVFFYFLIVFVLVSIHLDKEGAAPPRASSISLMEGWELDSHEIVSLEYLPPEALTLSRELEETRGERVSLCLKSIDTVFDVYADGELLYSYHPVIPKRLGVSYGMYVHTVAIPEEAKTLSLHAQPLFDGTSPSFHDVVLEEAGAYMNRLYRDNLLPFMRSSVILAIGVLFLTVGIFGQIIMHTAGLDFVSFGLLSILIGFTGFNDTLLLQVLTGHPALIRVITYVCLIYIPYPIVSFFTSATGCSGSKIVPAFLVLCLANFGLQVLLTHRGVTDYYYLVYLSHSFIVLALLAISYMVLRAIRRRTIRKELLLSLTIGLSACLLGTGVDICRYYLGQSYGSSSYSRLGMLIFTLLMGIYLFREQTRVLREKQKENATFISEITTAFAKVIDMKDSSTNGHSFRVAEYTAMLARELGLEEETVEKYYRIALLHDVGKIGIPKAVLNKPGKLTQEEYEIIKSHTTKGYDVLKDISIMPELSVGARSHHERPDGLGYPEHLSGEEIPRVAQIIAVADCFDAMYSNRPYRSRMNFEKAVSIIQEVSGTQLTPDVVDAFLRLVAKGKFKAPDDDGLGSTENIENIHGGES